MLNARCSFHTSNTICVRYVLVFPFFGFCFFSSSCFWHAHTNLTPLCHAFFLFCSTCITLPFWCIAHYSIAIATTYFLVYVFFSSSFYLMCFFHLFFYFIFMFFLVLVGWLAGALLPHADFDHYLNFLYNLLCHANKTRERERASNMRNRMEFHTSLSFAFTWNIWKL